MEWQKELIKIVSEMAPILGSALAGPTGGMVGTLIANTFGKATDASLVDKIKNDPEAAEKLKQLEMDHEAELRKLSVQQSAIDALKSIVEMG